MTFARKTMSLITGIGVALSLVAGLVVAVSVYLDEAELAGKADRMLKTGVVVAATPTYASSSTTKRRRGGSSTTYSISYAFWDAQNRRVDGSDTAPAGEYSALTDSSRPGTIRAGVRLDVVYDRANPSNNGLKSRFEKQREIDYFTIGIALAVVFGVGLLITWGVRSFMKKRLAPEPTPAPAPSWQPPTTA